MPLADVTAAEWGRIRGTADLLIDTPAELWDEIARAEFGDSEALRLAAIELARSFDDAPDFFGFPVFSRIEQPPPEAVLSTGAMVGAYRIEGEIGRGGMGRVYKATRADGSYSRTVAIKLVRVPGQIAVERFRAERRIHAELEHENIARLHDAGANDDGSLYFVMEYIDGVPIDVFCRGVDPKSIVTLFRTVASAVAFAHGMGVVHRDLKPANILVNAAGCPKLLDFGIASLRSSPVPASAYGVTPASASPEQLRGGIATERSDVYSLGLMLRSALAAHPDAMARDLNAIVEKALAEDPAGRYPGAAEFSADLTRWLRSLPVEARPRTWDYRLGLFLRRHRIASVLTAGLLLALGGGTAGILWQRHRVQLELQATGEIVRNVLAQETGMRSLAGATELRRSLVQQALNQLRTVAPEGARDPDLACDFADAYLRIGLILGMPGAPSLGDYAGAEASIRRGRALAEDIVRRWPQSSRGSDLLATGLSLEEALLGWRGDDAACIRQGERAQAAFRQFATLTPDLTAARVRNEEMLARCYTKAGRLDDAIRTVRDRIARGERENAPVGTLVGSYGRLARTLYEAGYLEDGRAAFRRSIELYRAVYRETPVHPAQISLAQELISAAAARPRPCRDPEDQIDIRESLALASQAFATDANNVTALSLLADAQRCLAMNLTSNNQVSQGFSLLEQNRRLLMATDVTSSSVRKRLAQNWLETAVAADVGHDWSSAVSAADKAVDALQRGAREPGDGLLLAEAWSQRGVALNKGGRTDDAITAWRRQLQIMRTYAHDLPGRNTQLELARTLHETGRRFRTASQPDASDLMSEAVRTFESVPFPPAREVAEARRDLSGPAPARSPGKAQY